MPAFLRVNPHLRVNLENVTVVREPDLNEEFEVLDTTRPGPAVRRKMKPSMGTIVVEFVGKKQPVVLTGSDAEKFKNFVDGVGNTLSGSGEAEEIGTADLTSAMREQRDFGALTGGT